MSALIASLRCAPLMSKNPEGYLLADNEWSDHMITIYEADLTVAEARNLRDWLNKVLT